MRAGRACGENRGEGPDLRGLVGPVERTGEKGPACEGW